MVLVFIMLLSMILILLVFVILLFSSLKIEIRNLKVGNKEQKSKKRIKEKYEIKIGLYLLEKIPILWFRFNNKKMRKIYNSKQLEKIDFRKIESKVSFNKKMIETIKNIKIRIKKLNLKIEIGTEDAIVTSYLIAIIASFIGILLPHLAKENINSCHYIVNPKYQNKNEYHVSLDGIICIKIVHIIYSMLIFRKGRKEYERTSNRRPYAYRYE